MNIIDLATKAMQTAIKSVVDSIKSVVDTIKTTTDGTKTKVDTIDTRTNTMNTNVNTVNTNVNTVNTNLGSPTTSANNATSANAHAKLNFLTSKATEINSKISGTLGLLGDTSTSFKAYTTNIPLPQISKINEGQYSSQATTLAYSLNGAGRIKLAVLDGGNVSPSRMRVVIDDKIELNAGGTFAYFMESDIVFASSVKIYKEGTSSAAKIGVLYELF